MEKSLPAIPAKRYFTIGEVSDLCGVKPYVLRYWEQEFTQLKPMKRRGNRRYYQHHEVLLIRRIRELLYEQGFTISGARNRLAEQHGAQRHDGAATDGAADGLLDPDEAIAQIAAVEREAMASAVPGPARDEVRKRATAAVAAHATADIQAKASVVPAGLPFAEHDPGAILDANGEAVMLLPIPEVRELSLAQMRTELLSIRTLLTL